MVVVGFYWNVVEAWLWWRICDFVILEVEEILEWMMKCEVMKMIKLGDEDGYGEIWWIEIFVIGCE